MNSHFATPTIDQNGDWLDLTAGPNVSSDISCTGGQMPRALGIALASKKYRDVKELKNHNTFSNNGNEISFVTIGDASTSEGVFFEAVNAACVMKVPMVICVWDDAFGISVPIEYQTTKKSISKALHGFKLENGEGMEIIEMEAWDYEGMRKGFKKGADFARKNHQPVLLHVRECTQPQGHSTSGSHERYKTAERLQWEKDFDCIKKMGEWLIKKKYIKATDIEELEAKAKKEVKEARDRAWTALNTPIKATFAEIDGILSRLEQASANGAAIATIRKEMGQILSPVFHELVQKARKAKFETINEANNITGELTDWLATNQVIGAQRYETNLYSASDNAAVNIPAVPAVYNEDSKKINGYQILNNFFDITLNKYPEVLAFGEDVGMIGDVNQGFAGLQGKYSEDRVFDCGIREWTIMGQAIGLAIRGLRPIAEIQYLDYLPYGLQPLMDDLATLRWRSNGIQQAPAIIRTRGHRLEGVWHAGSPMGMILSTCRGMYLCTPRNMTQAAGMYNTLLQSDDPAIVVECLNGYRLKEKAPANLGEFTVPLGVPEVLNEGSDVTLVTYGSCVRVAEAGIKMLAAKGISVELIDVQTLMPFDLEHQIVESLKKTNRIVFMDEDIPGGATAFMMQEVLEKQGGYRHLDSATKPNPEDVFETIYNMMQESGF